MGSFYNKILTFAGQLRGAVAAKADATSIASEFDATASYAVGDIVMYNGARYKCTTAHSGAWAAADFTAESVQTAIESGGGSAGGIPADAHYVYVNSQGQICYNPDQTGGGGGEYPSGTSLSFAIAPEFSTSSTYAVGDVVMYAGLRYICTTAVATAGEWTGSTNWTEQTVQEALPYSQTMHTLAAGTTSIAPAARSGDYYDATALTSSDTVAITLPAVTTGKVADCVITIETGSTVPTLNFGSAGDVFITNDSSWATLTASAYNVITLTSAGASGKWIVGRITTAK